MTIATTAGNFESVREALNRADINVLADMIRQGAFGDMLRSLPVTLRSQAASATGAKPQQVATLGTIELPEDAKAAYIFRATVKACAVTPGEFTVQSYGTTPATTQVAVAPNGDIVFLGSDGVTSVDVIYLPQKGDVIGNCGFSKLGSTTLTLSVSAGVANLPTAYSGKAILLMQANAVAGTVTGQKQILVPATAATAAGTAALSKDGTKVYCNNATDAVSSIQVDILVASGLVSGVTEMGAFLEMQNGAYT